MPAVTVHHSTPITKTFRVEQVAGIFDLPLADATATQFTVHVPPLTGPGSDWSIGAIIGPSGSGKSSVARRWLGDHAAGGCFVKAFDWPDDRSILDGFPPELASKDFTAALTAVGFSSPPVWVQPYHTLSDGQKFRADLARALLLDTPHRCVGMDEFGGTVTEQVAQFAAAAIAKGIRRGAFPNQKFVAVGARSEFAQWIEPDWVLDMSERRLARGWVQPPEEDAEQGEPAERDQAWCRKHFSGRPPIDIEVVRGTRDHWPRFEPHHYLSANLHRAARVYLATWRAEPIAFCATLPQPGKFTGYRRCHRLVVLPDYQGMGIGLKLLDAVAALELAADSPPRCRRFSITTSHPALMRALHRRPTWTMTTLDRGNLAKLRSAFHASAATRTTASFAYARQ
ncbi:MAG: GNAT family N-acetyltransferase [Planctomycetota bacterium]